MLNVLKIGHKVMRQIDDQEFAATIISINESGISIRYEDDSKIEHGVGLDEIKIINEETGELISSIIPNLSHHEPQLCFTQEFANKSGPCTNSPIEPCDIDNFDLSNSFGLAKGRSFDDSKVCLNKPRSYILRRVKSLNKLMGSAIVDLLPMAGNCHNCRKLSTLRCHRCSGVFYCSRKCQRIKWPEHQQFCRFQVFVPFLSIAGKGLTMQFTDGEDKRVRFSSSSNGGTVTPPKGTSSIGNLSTPLGYPSKKQGRFTAGELIAAISSIKCKSQEKVFSGNATATEVTDVCYEDTTPSQQLSTTQSYHNNNIAVNTSSPSTCEVYHDQSAVAALSDMLGLRVDIETEYRKVNAALLCFKDVNRAAEWFLSGVSELPCFTAKVNSSGAKDGQSSIFDDNGVQVGGNGWDISATGDVILRPTSQDYDDLPPLVPCDSNLSSKLSKSHGGEPISLLTGVKVTIGTWTGEADVTQTSSTDFSMTVRIHISADTSAYTTVNTRSPYRLFLSAADVEAICSFSNGNAKGDEERARLVLQQLAEFRHSSEDGSQQYLGIQIECGSRAVCQSYGQEWHAGWTDDDGSGDWRDDEEVARYANSTVSIPPLQRGDKVQGGPTLTTVSHRETDEELQQNAMMLVEMLGVEMDRAAEALNAFNGDMEQTVDWLLASAPGAPVPGRTIVPFCGPVNENYGLKYNPAKVHPIDDDV